MIWAGTGWYLEFCVAVASSNAKDYDSENFATAKSRLDFFARHRQLCIESL